MKMKTVKTFVIGDLNFKVELSGVDNWYLSSYCDIGNFSQCYGVFKTERKLKNAIQKLKACYQ